MKNYVLVGAGGTGSFLADPLARYIEARHRKGGRLHIVDGDVVEQKNLTRQSFQYTDIRRYKADAVAHRIDPMPNTITDFLDHDNIGKVIQNGDTILIATDNYYVRRLIDERADTLRDVTVINGGNGTWKSSVQFHVKRDGENLTPRITFMHPEIATAEPVELGPSCTATAETDPQTIGANLMSAAWMLMALQVIEERLANDAYILWHEMHIDPQAGVAGGVDWRLDGPQTWQTHSIIA